MHILKLNISVNYFNFMVRVILVVKFVNNLLMQRNSKT